MAVECAAIIIPATHPHFIRANRNTDNAFLPYGFLIVDAEQNRRLAIAAGSHDVTFGLVSRVPRISNREIAAVRTGRDVSRAGSRQGIRRVDLRHEESRGDRTTFDLIDRDKTIARSNCIHFEHFQLPERCGV